ncbi:hypothetical protein XENTR_v10017737 [Xenopus tropicalis]|nr:hypothetical protein XENTR_v10017737 [Xenopus tropicalis]
MYGRAPCLHIVGGRAGLYNDVIQSSLQCCIRLIPSHGTCVGSAFSLLTLGWAGALGQINSSSCCVAQEGTMAVYVRVNVIPS